MQTKLDNNLREKSIIKWCDNLCEINLENEYKNRKTHLMGERQLIKMLIRKRLLVNWLNERLRNIKH